MSEFTENLNTLSNLALEISGVKHPYTGDDLCNALLVLSEVGMSLMVDEHGRRLPQEGMEALAEEFGKSLRQTITLFTGIDPAHYLAEQMKAQDINEDTLKALKLK